VPHDKASVIDVECHPWFFRSLVLDEARAEWVAEFVKVPGTCLATLACRFRYNALVPRIFLGNFNFEHELAKAGDGLALSQVRTGRPADLAGSDRNWAWVAIAESHDVVLTAGELAKADFGELADLGLPIPQFMEFARSNPMPDAQLVPWGWTDAARDFASQRGWECLSPPTEIVRQVNSRVFRYEAEREWGIGLAGSAVASSLGELEAALQSYGNAPRGWLLKTNFGMSGREARRGRGTRLDENTRNWSRRRLQTAGPIVVEPVVERVAEAGIQIEIPQTGEPALVGVTPLRADSNGAYRGSRFACPASENEVWQPAVDTGLLLAKRLQRLGYFGPLGVDAMQYRDAAGEVCLRPLQDVNARYTMGRLALGLRRILPVGWRGSWLHFSTKHLAGRAIDFWLNGLQRSLPRLVRVIPTSPQRIEGQPSAHHAVVVFASTEEILKQAEADLLSSLGIPVDGL
jgi:hypothetical protein